MDAFFAIVLIGILAILATTIPMDLGPAADPADTHFLPRPEWYYRPALSMAQVSQRPLVFHQRHIAAGVACVDLRCCAVSRSEA
jgi:hypothetical protein